MIFITGAGGTVGRHLVARLLASGTAMRVGVHSDPSGFWAERLDTCRIDLDQPDTLQRAFEGVATLFLLAPNGERQRAQEMNALEAAKRAGVGHIVKLSAWRAPERAFSFARLHREIECAIEASGLSWTFLRPCGFMQNFTNAMADSIRRRSAFHLPAGEARVSHIDVRDLAEIAARVLTTPGHAGQAYALSGPQALSYGEAARILSDALGRPIRYVDQAEADAAAAMSAVGLSVAYIADVLDLFRAYRDGAGEAVTDDAAGLLGRPAITFQNFVHDHAGVFR